ncbi:MAG: FAD-dependent oxidoreductase [Pirellulales bacterium]
MRIAIVGGGVSGLTAALLLRRRHEITLFEADDRLGGHSHTVDVTIDGRAYPVDTGFIVFNDRTYPKFEAILTALGVALRPGDMSFGVRDERDGMEYCGTSLKTLFAQ